MAGILGGGGTTVVNSTPAMSDEEKALVQLNTELAKKQLASVEAIQPFQQELLNLSLSELRRQGAISSAIDSAITPEQQAAAAKAEFERAQRLGPMQDELLQLQLEQLRSGGAATDAQKATIAKATDSAITAGAADINLQTQRGIGLIADELANSRGLRLSDSPITQEAALLTRAGNDQVASLTKNLRAGQAAAELNFPLAAGQLMSGINQNQQNLLNNAQQFQADLRNRAYQNRLLLTGQGSNTGIGLASIGGGGAAALNALASNRAANSTQTTRGGGANLSGIGSIMSGAGALFSLPMFAGSDRRLKNDYGVVGHTAGGIPLHVYRYKNEDARDPLRLGVMADDVEKVNPDAVTVHKSGYKVVDYRGIF